ncbi:MAG: PrsW family intramembrane metalloprotease [Brumimicrobium sp.]|nr:PrsW family intramembrane metalloprotease [Brumimicrobium sp.]
MNKTHYIIIGGFIIIVLVINFLIPDWKYRSYEEQAEYQINTGRYAEAENTYLELITEQIGNIDYHHKLLTTHFSYHDGSVEDESREDELYDFYRSLSETSDDSLADIGYYCLGLINGFWEKPKEELQQLSKVKNRDLKYLNNSLGVAFLSLESLDSAEYYLRLEIQNGGNLSEAYPYLSYLLYYLNRLDGIDSLLRESPQAKEYITNDLQSAVYFLNGNVSGYIGAVFYYVFHNFNFWGFLAAILIMGSWMMYLRKVDIYEPEKWGYVLFTLGLGMIFSFLVHPITDYLNLVEGFTLNGEIVNDFLYCVFGIGAIEELVKIIPLFIMLRYTKEVNEPYDYILYASISALGFAFIENLIYLDSTSLTSIHGRALTAVVMHMFLSSIIAYGIILNKYKLKKNPAFMFIIFFLIASIAHGFYDFWLINLKVDDFSFLSIVLLIIGIIIWNFFKNNALNNSQFYDEEKIIESDKLGNYLFYSLAGIFAFEYVAIALKYDAEYANDALVESIYSGLYLIVFISGKLSQTHVEPGKWLPLTSAFKERLVDQSIVGTELQLQMITNNDITTHFLPNNGTIAKVFFLSKEPYYVVALEKIQLNSEILGDRLVVRLKDDLIFEQDKVQVVAVYTALKDVSFNNKIQKRNFKFVGWAKSKLITKTE